MTQTITDITHIYILKTMTSFSTRQNLQDRLTQILSPSEKNYQ
ncbi:hypothetical protein DSUL_50047 [Desulfovibrionales bacterium]